jgi:hypothetical protein
MTLSGIAHALMLLIAAVASFIFHLRNTRELSVIFIGGFLFLITLMVGSLDWGETVTPTLGEIIHLRTQRLYLGATCFAIGAGIVVGHLLARVFSYLRR